MANHASSYYYPVRIEEFLDCIEAADHHKTGDFLAVFLDADGSELTFRIHHGALESLARAVAARRHAAA